MSDRSQHLSDEVILQFIDHEVSARLSERIKEHLAICSGCRNRHLSLTSTSRTLVEIFKSESFEPSSSAAASRAQLRSRLAQRGPHPAALPIPAAAPHFRTWAVALMTVMMLGIVFYGLRYTREGREAVTLSGEAITPNRSLTPGAVRPVTLSEICSVDDGDLDPRVSSTTERAVMQEYGLSSGTITRNYQIDYLVNPQLGGTGDIRNLWPEPYSSGKWNAQAKDELERQLHKMVCARTVDLTLAQREIETNWIAAYKKYMGHEHS
jgi:Putative zinc-finger